MALTVHSLFKDNNPATIGRGALQHGPAAAKRHFDALDDMSYPEKSIRTSKGEPTKGDAKDGAKVDCAKAADAKTKHVTQMPGYVESVTLEDMLDDWIANEHGI